MRFVSLLVLALLLTSTGTVLAQSDAGSPAPDDQAAPAEESAPPEEAAAPAGPVLQPSDLTPIVCDPSSPRFRYLEVRGTGFDAWSTQHLIGNLFDASGASRAHWSSVWVTPDGRVTLEVNLCADPMQNRGALDVGDYTVAVSQSDGSTIASAGISLAPPASPDAEVDASLPATPATPTPTPFTLVSPNIAAPPTPTPIPLGGVAPVSSPAAVTGPGSFQQPLPAGATGNLVDGWQMLIQGVTTDAYEGIKAAIPSATAPAADQTDVMLRVQATYAGPGTGLFSGTRIALYSTATQQTYNQVVNNCGVIPDALPPNLVAQGSVVRGNVCFMVRRADIGSLLAVDNQTSVTDRRYFNLQ